MESKKNSLLPTFGRHRARRLRPTPAGLIEGVLPKLAIALPEKEFDPRELFPGKKEVWLEIGFGDGAHLAHLAKQYPDVGFIGCEPFVNGVAALLKLIAEIRHSATSEARSQNPELDAAVKPQHDGVLTNIRIFQGDARLLVEKIKPHSLARSYIFHPDPWPKARHHKRRLISKEFLPVLHEKLVKGGAVKIATDWADYANWILEHAAQLPQFKWTAKTAADWTTRFAESCETKYAKKAKAEGRVPAYFEFVAL